MSGLGFIILGIILVGAGILGKRRLKRSKYIYRRKAYEVSKLSFRGRE